MHMQTVTWFPSLQTGVTKPCYSVAKHQFDSLFMSKRHKSSWKNPALYSGSPDESAQSSRISKSFKLLDLSSITVNMFKPKAETFISTPLFICRWKRRGYKGFCLRLMRRSQDTWLQTGAAAIDSWADTVQCRELLVMIMHFIQILERMTVCYDALPWHSSMCNDNGFMVPESLCKGYTYSHQCIEL